MSEDDTSLAAAHARVGAVLKEKWRLDSLIGVGGMAAVYAATHRNKNRVAVKVLHAHFSGQETVRERFLREGYLANMVEHAGAVKVLDDDVADDGSAFLVMELLDGETIEARWERKGRRLEPGEVLAIGDKLLDVLAAAHGKGVVHRDIKPENIFLTREGTLKVLDFGIARIFEGAVDPKGTRQGYIMGTPAFMAPEQALARWDAVDGRTDVWGAGATMFTLLTGRHVHEGQTGNEQLIKSATTPAASIGTVDPSLPAPVVDLIDKALAFEMTDRWADARTMRQSLRRAYQEIRSNPTPGAHVGTLVSASLTGSRTASHGGLSVPPSAATSRAGSTASGAKLPVSPRVSRPDLPAQRGSQGVSALDPAAVLAQLSACEIERDAREAELASAMPAVNDSTQRLAGARRKVLGIEQRILDAKNENAALDAQFRRQTSSKVEGVGEARRQLRDAMVAFAEVAIADTRTIGSEFDLARGEVAKLWKAAEARARDVVLYERALQVHDAEGVKRGVFVLAAAAALIVALFFVPFVARAVANGSAPARPSPVVTAPP
jgi:serine/threonine protein kinase